MSDEGVAQSASAPAPAQEAPEANDSVDIKLVDAPAAADDAKADEPEPTEEKADGKTPAEPTKEEQASKPTEESTETPAEKPTEDSDVEMKDAPDATTAPSAEEAPKEDKTEQAEASEPAAGGDDSAAAAAPNASKTKTPARRKSAAGADGKGKKLNKKASKAAILHIDAKPGDHYFIKLKGFPQWPCVICDEDMLPHALIKTRPVSAARPDGEYREDYADGGKRAADRSFPIMYLATNEFGWVSNKDLIDLDPATVADQATSKMRKDLVLAHQIASEGHDLDYYKEVLQQFQEELIEKQKAAEAKAAAAATPKKSKSKAKASSEAEDVEMEDVDEDTAPTKAKKDKKRKSPEDSEGPQRSESVKKPKIKLTNNATPKAANGATPKAAKAGAETKGSKKAKKPAKEADAEEKAQSPKEPEMSAEDRFERKKKEVLFLRHKLQKGLLTRDQQPKEDEMKVMSDYLVKLEQFPDLETEIIRATKINKVLKAMLKLESIPKEEEFNFKPRSQVLLDKWTKLLQADEAPVSASVEENGVNGHSSEAPAKEEAKADVNGTKKAEAEDEEAEAPKTEDKEGVKSEEAKPEEVKSEEAKSEPKESEKEVEKATEAPKKEETASEEKPVVEEAAKDTEAVDAST
ncbi:hypothetical protein VPNG_01925 [Cytospora leucostoma]|uniref:PWWP domain-containing protein n=1 Tax=Cytospora leucostoma TaxID=1230097 RepID=A0A423XIB0_9PEZI|nr:hypothetical protein VPNG_01925 [Cytospora leucostoma]